VQSRDVIGWTNEESHTLISVNLDETYLVRFYNIDPGTSFPAVNETVKVNNIVYPGVFSVAVEIIQRQYFVRVIRELSV